MKNILLEIENLNIDYLDGESSLVAAKDIGFSIFEGETLGIIGESGSGKTSIANAIMRILPANASVSGRISCFYRQNLSKSYRTCLSVNRRV